MSPVQKKRNIEIIKVKIKNKLLAIYYIKGSSTLWSIKKWFCLNIRLKTAVETPHTHTHTHKKKRLMYKIQISQTPSNMFFLFVSELRHSPLKHQSHRNEVRMRTNDYRVRGINGRRTERNKVNDCPCKCSFFFFCSVMWMYREQWCRRGWQTDGRTEDSVASDVGDSTFAVFLQGDFYIGGGDVAFLSALLPRPCPAVAFILLDDIQHLQWWRCQNNTMSLSWWLASVQRIFLLLV